MPSASRVRPHPIQFRADSEEGLRAELTARRTEKRGLGATATRDLERYYRLIGHYLPPAGLEESDVLAIAEAVRDYQGEPEWAVLKDLPGLSRDLARTLQLLPPFEAAALLDAIERMWLLPEGTTEERARAVGLIR